MSLTRTRRESTTRTREMTRSLARSSSVSLVLPLAPHQQTSAIVYSLRRAQSSIPAVEYCVVSSDFGTASNSQNNNSNKGYNHNQHVVESGNNNGNNNNIISIKGDVEGEQDSYCSDYTSCSSSIADLFDIVDEPQRVSKDILRSVSISYQWLDLTLQEFELPTCRADAMTDVAMTGTVPDEQQKGAITNDGVEGRRQSIAGSLPGSGLPVGRQGSLRFAYIHECRTGSSLVSHVELKTAMDSLRHWTMQVPRNCCLSYRHDTTGEVATLPWPDLEAGGMDEIEEFVSTVNSVEGKPVFFPRYERSPYDPPKSLSSQKSLYSQKSLSSQKSSTSSPKSFSTLPPLSPTPMRS